MMAADMLALSCHCYPAHAAPRLICPVESALRPCVCLLYPGAGTSKDSVDCIYRSNTRALANVRVPPEARGVVPPIVLGARGLPWCRRRIIGAGHEEQQESLVPSRACLGGPRRRRRCSPVTTTLLCCWLPLLPYAVSPPALCALVAVPPPLNRVNQVQVSLSHGSTSDRPCARHRTSLTYGTKPASATQGEALPDCC